MYKVKTIFTLIFVSLQRGSSDHSGRFSRSPVGCIPESMPYYKVALGNHRPGGYEYRRHHFYDPGLRCVDVDYYDCTSVTRLKTTGNIYIKCPCEHHEECCPDGILVFNQGEELGSFWECSLRRIETSFDDYRAKYAGLNGESYELTRKIINKNNGPTENQYIILHRFWRDDNYNQSKSSRWDKESINCNVEEMNENVKELVCRKYPFIFLFQISRSVIRCLCIAFGSATLLVFILLPPLRTMKTTVILCQTLSYLMIDLVVLRYYLRHSVDEWQPTYTECIIVVYNWHYWDLAGSFWSNIVSIDLALTFRDRGLNRGMSRRTFLLYSLYGWGAPLIITLVTAILGFWVTLPAGFLKPVINEEFCWFPTRMIILIYHYIPEMVLSTINTLLLGYAVYKVIRNDCTSDVLHNKDSRCHVGNQVKKVNRTRLILYFNLALLVGSPKGFEYAKLLLIETEARVWHDIRLVRVISMFLFIVCKKRVFKIFMKQLHLERLSVPFVFTMFSQKSNDVSSPKVANSVHQESTRL